MTLATAVERLKPWGCTVETSNENDVNTVMMVDPDGNYLHLTGGSHAILGANDTTMVTRPTGIEDETTRVVGKAYGLSHNDPTAMAHILDMAVEGEVDYEGIMNQICQWLDESEDEPTF